MIKSGGRRLQRALLVAGAAGVAAVLAPAAALAAPGGPGHTVTMTEVTHGVFDAGLTGPNPCTGADIVFQDASGTVVNHVTFFPAGDEAWGTFTETGKVTLTDSNGVTYTGHLTLWGNFNVNEKNANNTFTLTVMLAGSDGSSITDPARNSQRSCTWWQIGADDGDLREILRPRRVTHATR
jgi:hypothetical protein